MSHCFFKILKSPAVLPTFPPPSLSPFPSSLSLSFLISLSPSFPPLYLSESSIRMRGHSPPTVSIRSREGYPGQDPPPSLWSQPITESFSRCFAAPPAELVSFTRWLGPVTSLFLLDQQTGFPPENSHLIPQRNTHPPVKPGLASALFPALLLPQPSGFQGYRREPLLASIL